MADVIICLGDVFSGRKNIECMKLRTEKAAELYKQNRAKKIIFTGGFKSSKDLSEAGFMSKIAVKLGVPKKDMILEEKANTTIGNAYYSERIMKKRKFRSAIVVTSPHHLRRAKYIFLKLIPDKKLEFEKSRSGLNFFESIPFYADEIWSLLKIKLFGIDMKRI